MVGNPITEELIEVIKYLPISIDKNDNGIRLDSNCYHLEENVIKESLKIMYKNADEIDTKILIPYFLGYEDVSKAAHYKVRNKII